MCVVDAGGKIVRESEVASEPDALIAWFGGSGSEWSGSGWRPGRCRNGCMRRCGRPGSRSSCWRPGTCSSAFQAMPVKTDRNDARGIAQLMRLGWFRPVHCKSMSAQEMRAILTARKLIGAKLLRCGDELARHSARVWPEGRADHPSALPRASGSLSPAKRRWRRLRKRCWRRTRFCCASSTG